MRKGFASTNHQKKNKHIFMLTLMFCLGTAVGMCMAAIFPDLIKPAFQNTVIPLQTGRLSNIQAETLLSDALKAVGSTSDVIYIAEGTPSVTLGADCELLRLNTSVLIPEAKGKDTRYVLYQVRVDKPGELFIVKCEDVSEPQRKIPMSDFWNALSFLPIDTVAAQVNGKPDQYMLTFYLHTVMGGTWLDAARNVFYYNRQGLTEPDALAPLVNFAVTPLYVQTEYPYGYHGRGEDSFVLYYCE